MGPPGTLGHPGDPGLRLRAGPGDAAGSSREAGVGVAENDTLVYTMEKNAWSETDAATDQRRLR